MKILILIITLLVVTWSVCDADTHPDHEGVWLFHTNGVEQYFGDDWRAITNARDHASTGDVFYIGEGVYEFGSRTGVGVGPEWTLVGAGRPVYNPDTHNLEGGTFIKGSIFVMKEGGSLYSIGIQPHNTNTPANGYNTFGVCGTFHLLWTQKADNVVSDVAVFCKSGILDHGIEMYGTGGRIENCHVVNPKNHGIVIKGGQNWIIKDCLVELGCLANAYLSKSAPGPFGSISNLIFESCVASNVSGSGFHIQSYGTDIIPDSSAEPFAYASNMYTTIKQCSVDDVGKWAVWIDGMFTQHTVVTNCYFENYRNGCGETHPQYQHALLDGNHLDKDGDAMSDEWELEYSGTTTGMNAMVDSDGDGMLDCQEWIGGTDPTNQASTWAFSSVNVSNNRLSIRWPSRGHRVYDLMTFDLKTGHKEVAASNLAATAPINTVVFTNMMSTKQNHQFILRGRVKWP